MSGEEEFVKSSGYYCEWGWVEEKSGPEPFIAAKMPPGTAGKISVKSKIDFRLGVFVEKIRAAEVGLIIVLFRIEGCQKTFIAPVNHYDRVIPNPVQHAIKSGYMRIKFYEDKPEPFLQLKSTVDLAGLKPSVDVVATLPAWSDADFRAALGSVKETPEQLWEQF